MTYRIYDPYGRKTHLEKARYCVREVKINKGKMKLEMEEFYAEVVEVNGEKNFQDDRVNVIVALNEVFIRSKNSLKLNEYESCIILPNNEYAVEGEGFVVRIYPLEDNN